MGEFIFNLLINVLEGLSYAGGWRRTPPPLPTQPTELELMGMILGAFVVFFGFVGLFIFLHQWTSERLVLREAAAPAVIVSIERRPTGGDRSFDVRLDYQRQGPAGPVACRRAPARLGYGPKNLEVGQTVQVHPQPGSCAQPIYSPDIGNPQTTLWASLFTFPVGITLFGGCYSSMRRRQRRLMMTALNASHTLSAS